MRRLMATKNADGERGAVAVMFALLLVGLIGFIALAVDLGAVYSKRQELQNAADSAALAAAQECATTGCVGASAVATDYAERNTYDPLTDVVTTPGGNYVQVDVHGTQQRWFLPVLGADSSGPVEATAYATWSAPSEGTLSLPLTISMCDFDAMGGPSGAPTTIWLTKEGESGCEWGEEDLAMPGGFGLVGEGTCEVYIDAEYPWIPVDSGANLPCTDSEIAQYLNKVILVPIFDLCRKGGGGEDVYCPISAEAGLGAEEKEYHIYSFAAFRLLDYSFPGTQTKKNCGEAISGNESCIRGEFIEWVLVKDAADYPGEMPDLGATVVQLIDPRDLP